MTQPQSSGNTPRTCASCGAQVAGRFCAQCGAPAHPGACRQCQATLSAGARYCHRCGCATTTGPATGAPVAAGGRERTGWMIVAGAVLLAAFLVVWERGRSTPASPDMANAGNAGNAGTVAPVSGRAPDISNMSPREQFDRLYARIFSAAERGDTATVLQFAPMGIGAYGQLESVDADARFHAAMIHLLIGEYPSALALADTIEAAAPGHLLGYVIRGEAADRQNDAATLNRAYRDFLSRYDAELKSGRPEYGEHRPSLDDFRTRARATLGQ